MEQAAPVTQVEPTTEADRAQAAEPARLGRKRDHTRDPEILRCALDVLAEEGYEGMTIEMVAARAKAGKATLYRRWASKNDLVIDAVACMKKGDQTLESIPDTGSLRGDLVGMIRPHSIDDAEKKLRVMSGLASLLAKNPELAEVVNSAIVEPRVRINRTFFTRAIERGEISPDVDIETLSMVSSSMAAYRTLILKKTVDRAFLVSLIDGVILPACGLRAPGSSGA
ncbi:TetR/AcrR family transcriptional regulator [Frondihabitans peucedani]|uniref:TetR/AcrR family transcriptional regulator n=1 Tax=Frondihabitans peucedani TaxID=598626 RepID=A0ABP8E3U1_9MICO